jgi:uncharacterized protein YjiS (DUF1127 family)
MFSRFPSSPSDGSALVETAMIGAPMSIPTSDTIMTRHITTVAKSPERGIFRKHARGSLSPANRPWEKSMTFANHASDRRPRAQIRPRRTEPQSFQDKRRRAGALISLPQHDARAQPPSPIWSSLTVKAATTLSYSAGHALPALLFAFVSWAVAEILSGCAAYAEAMYAPPAARDLVPAATKPGLNLMMTRVNGSSAGHIHQARPDTRAAALPAEWRNERPAVRADWHVSLTRVVAACWSSLCRSRNRRRAIEELRGLDDRSLRDIGIARSDIEYIVRYGARRE